MIGPSFNWMSSDALKYLDDGWTVGAGVTYHGNPYTEISADLSFSRFGFAGPVIDHRRFTDVLLPGWGVPSHVGDPTKIYEAAGTIRFVDPSGPFTTFFIFRGGVGVIQIGKITHRVSMDPSFEEDYVYVHPGTGGHEAKVFGSVGCGFGIPLYKLVELAIEGRASYIFADSSWLFPIVTSFRFRL